MDKTVYFEQMRRKRRSEILSASREMIINQGIASFNIQQLARDLDISTVTLYKYFKNSDDIIYALEEEIIDVTLKDLSNGIIVDTENTAEAIKELHRTFYRYVLLHYEDFMLLTLFQLHIRTLTQAESHQYKGFPYVSLLNEQIHGLLLKGQTEGIIKKELLVDETLDFMSCHNTAMLQHIGLMGKERFLQDQKALQKHIDMMIFLFISYISV